MPAVLAAFIVVVASQILAPQILASQVSASLSPVWSVVREELAAAPGSSGVSSRDGLEEGSDDDTQ
ncbi:hypothetical protein ABIC08_007601, partial [Bradyrhizobium sp. RT9b]|uniref:hypothetical protein n=1 Tax=unclassified Bradyrhizobium TaxID=2631580 RepID=UPI00339818AA